MWLLSVLYVSKYVASSGVEGLSGYFCMIINKADVLGSDSWGVGAEVSG